MSAVRCNPEAFQEAEMKAQDTKFSKEILIDCMNESKEAAEACRLALKKVEALERKVERLANERKK
jgi:hypothetical protein